MTPVLCRSALLHKSHIIIHRVQLQQHCTSELLRTFQFALQARHPEESHVALFAVAACMFAAAFFPPKLRTLSFGLGVSWVYATNFTKLTSPHVTLELLLYTCSGVAFVRCAQNMRPRVPDTGPPMVLLCTMHACALLTWPAQTPSYRKLRTLLAAALCTEMKCITGWPVMRSSNSGKGVQDVVCTCRNGGHKRGNGLQDHHILHYCATASCLLHLAHLYAEIGLREARQLPQ